MLYTIVTDHDFFREVPEFAFMKGQAAAAQKLVLGPLLGEDGCGDCMSISKAMKPVMATFIGHVRQLLTDSPEALDNLLQYITRKRGYRPLPITLLYRDTHGNLQRIEF